MPNLTADQARALAASFHNLAASLADYRFSKWDELTAAQRSQLESVQWTLLNSSSDFSTRAIQITLDSAGPSAEQLVTATNRLGKTLKTLKDVGKVLAYAALAVKLAAAIVTENPGAIAGAIADVAAAV